MNSLSYPNLPGSLDKYFQHLCNDLEVFAAHAGYLFWELVEERLGKGGAD